MSIVYTCFSCLNSSFSLASLVLLGLRGSSDIAFVATACVFAVCHGIQLILALATDHAHVKQIWSEFHVYAFLASMIQMGLHGIGDGVFIAFSSMTLVLWGVQFVVNFWYACFIHVEDERIRVLFLLSLTESVATIAFYLFVASFVRLGTNGGNNADPMFAVVLSASFIMCLVLIPVSICVNKPVKQKELAKKDLRNTAHGGDLLDDPGSEFNLTDPFTLDGICERSSLMPLLV